MKEIILQEKRTLDDVLKTSVRTFRNGCNFKLRYELDKQYYLQYGCYGLLVNLINGDEKLLYNWLKNSEEGIKKLSGIVSPDTIDYLLKQKPCKLCGGAIFRKL